MRVYVHVLLFIIVLNLGLNHVYPVYNDKNASQQPINSKYMHLQVICEESGISLIYIYIYIYIYRIQLNSTHRFSTSEAKPQIINQKQSLYNLPCLTPTVYNFVLSVCNYVRLILQR